MKAGVALALGTALLATMGVAYVQAGQIDRLRSANAAQAREIAAWGVVADHLTGQINATNAAVQTRETLRSAADAKRDTERRAVRQAVQNSAGVAGWADAAVPDDVLRLLNNSGPRSGGDGADAARRAADADAGARDAR